MACNPAELVTNDDGQLLADSEGKLLVHNSSALECCGEAPLPCAICSPTSLESVVVTLTGFTNCPETCYESGEIACWDGSLPLIFCPDPPRLGCPDVLPPDLGCYPYATVVTRKWFLLRSINGSLAIPCTHRETNYCEFFRAVPYRRFIEWRSESYNTLSEEPPDPECPSDYVFEDETWDELAILVLLSLSSGTITMEVYVGTREFGSGGEQFSNIGFVTSGMTIAKEDFCDGESITRSNQSTATRACPHPFVHGAGGSISVSM